jgi:hypothetical protein
VHLGLVVLEELLLYEPERAPAAPLRQMFLLVLLQVLYEVVHVLGDIPSAGVDRRRFETERTLDGGTLVVMLVEVIDGHFVIGAAEGACAAHVGQLRGAVLLRHVLPQDEGVSEVSLAYQADETVVELGLVGVRAAYVLE